MVEGPQRTLLVRKVDKPHSPASSTQNAVISMHMQLCCKIHALSCVSPCLLVPLTHHYPEMEQGKHAYACGGCRHPPARFSPAFHLPPHPTPPLPIATALPSPPPAHLQRPVVGSAMILHDINAPWGANFWYRYSSSASGGRFFTYREAEEAEEADVAAPTGGDPTASDWDWVFVVESGEGEDKVDSCGRSGLPRPAWCMPSWSPMLSPSMAARICCGAWACRQGQAGKAVMRLGEAVQVLCGMLMQGLSGACGLSCGGL